nr:ABC transporter ATP-binding protein [uncultured Desulfobacter sp.]
MTVKPAVSFENVSMAFGRHTLFKNLNLDIAPGQVVGIQGPSGAGKSTLLKMAAGLIRPANGRVRVHASPLGYVFQEPRLLGWYTALENIRLALESAGMSGKTAKQTASRYLKDLDLTGFENHYPRELSGGMNQRVSIARALSVSPELLLLDEPFTGLDPALKDRVKELVRAMAEKTKACVIHVTHSKQELLPGTHALFTMDRGRLYPDSV